MAPHDTQRCSGTHLALCAASAHFPLAQKGVALPPLPPSLHNVASREGCVCSAPTAWLRLAKAGGGQRSAAAWAPGSGCITRPKLESSHFNSAAMPRTYGTSRPAGPRLVK